MSCVERSEVLRGMKRSIFLAAGAAAFWPRGVLFAAQTDVSVAYAGSLVALMEKSIGPAFSASGVAFHGEAKGSTAIANLIRDGLRTPDVFVSADTAAIESLFGTAGHDAARWYATFASTRMQIAYSPKSPHAADFAAAENGKANWYDVLAQPGVKVARTDPAQDPKGYRVLLVLQLAEKFYKKPGLSAKLLGDPENPEQVLPEESAVSRLETGDIDALWAYSTETATRGYAAIELPPQINLGDPSYATAYASASVTVAGKTYRGSPIVYAVTIPASAKNPAGAEAFIAYLVGPDGRERMKNAGLVPVAPALGGDPSAIPASLRTAFAAPVTAPSGSAS
jgi:molybdate/tungstate transport system substrate-binding protein